MSFLNECEFQATSGGTGDFVVSSAVLGFYTPAQCTNPSVVDGDIYTWRAETDSLGEYELFEGSYTAATTTVARTTILQSSNAGAKVNFTTAPKVRQVPSSQEVLDIVTSNRTYYVRTDGDDDNTGRANTAGGAFLTLQHAIDVVVETLYINEGAVVIIEVADGTYNELITINGHPGPGRVLLKGNTTTPGNVIIKPTSGSTFAAMTFNWTNRWDMAGFTVDASDAGFTGSCGIRFFLSDVDIGWIKIKTGNNDFGHGLHLFRSSCARSTELFHGLVGGNGTLEFDMPGDQLYAVRATQQSFWNFSGTGLVTFTGSPAYYAVVGVDEGSTIQANNSGGFTGTVTGYIVEALRCSGFSSLHNIGDLPGDNVYIDHSSSFISGLSVRNANVGVLESAGPPTTTGIPASNTCGVYRDTTAGAIRHYANFDGAIHEVGSEVLDATNNAVTVVKDLTHHTTGTPAAGIGAALGFRVETTAGNVERGAAIEAVARDVSAGSEDFDLVFKTMAAGATAAERVRIDSEGRITKGTAHATILGANSDLQFYGTDTNFGISLAAFSNSAPVTRPIILGKSRGTSVGDYTVVQADDRLGQIQFVGADGNELVQAASIEVRSDGTPGTGDMPARMSFFTSPDGSAALTSERLRINSSGRVMAMTPTGGIGYGTGAGGTVTQGTDKSTGVTLDKVTGQITMHNATLNAGTSVGFTLTNSAIATTDVVIVSIDSGATADSYFVGVDAVGAGSCRIHLRNVSAGNLGEAIVLNFAVIKAVTS